MEDIWDDIFNIDLTDVEIDDIPPLDLTSDEHDDDHKINHCLACGHEQQLMGKTDFYCERCGAKNYEDGSCSYDGSRAGIEDTKHRIEEFDKRYPR